MSHVCATSRFRDRFLPVLHQPQGLGQLEKLSVRVDPYQKSLAIDCLGLHETILSYRGDSGRQEASCINKSSLHGWDLKSLFSPLQSPAEFCQAGPKLPVRTGTAQAYSEKASQDTRCPRYQLVAMRTICGCRCKAGQLLQPEAA